MAKLKFKNSNGEWESIAAFQGEPGKPGKDGAIQYTAGEGIKIENDIISADVSGGIPEIAFDNYGALITTSSGSFSLVGNGDFYTAFRQMLTDHKDKMLHEFHLVSSKKDMSSYSGGKTPSFMKFILETEYRYTKMSEINLTLYYVCEMPHYIDKNKIMRYEMSFNLSYDDDGQANVMSRPYSVVVTSRTFATTSYVDNAIKTTLGGSY